MQTCVYINHNEEQQNKARQAKLAAAWTMRCGEGAVPLVATKRLI